MRRVMVFIDGSNMYHSLKLCAHRHDLDYYHFSKKICGMERKLVQIYYYNIELDASFDTVAHSGQQRFFYKLKQTPKLEMRLGRGQRKPDGSWCEKGVDVKLAIDMVEKAYQDQYDDAILVSADGDFSEVVQTIRKTGKRIELATFSGSQCYHLRQHVDKSHEIDGLFLADCWVENNGILLNCISQGWRELEPSISLR